VGAFGVPTKLGLAKGAFKSKAALISSIASYNPSTLSIIWL
jgi:hypothetical protein